MEGPRAPDAANGLSSEVMPVQLSPGSLCTYHNSNVGAHQAEHVTTRIFLDPCLLCMDILIRLSTGHQDAHSRAEGIQVLSELSKTYLRNPPRPRHAAGVEVQLPSCLGSIGLLPTWH